MLHVHHRWQLVRGAVTGPVPHVAVVGLLGAGGEFAAGRKVGKKSAKKKPETIRRIQTHIAQHNISQQKRKVVTVQYSTGYSTAQYNTVVQYSTAQHRAQYSAIQRSAVQYTAVRYSTAVQHSTVQYSTVQYSTVQYSTVQYSTVQYSTVQYNTCLLYTSDAADE